LSPSRRREAPCEGTNSARVFTPGERNALATIEIINNTRGGIEGEIWERGNGGQMEILDEHHTIFGLHLQPEKFKTRVTKLGVLYVCMSFLQTFPQILNSITINSS
jgi:hypothetical protein